jgi:hypothetical protein
MRGLIENKQYAIFITDNGLYAYLELLRVRQNNLPKVTSKQILNKLKELNVCYGINKKVIDSSLRRFYSSSVALSPSPILIARGNKPEHKQVMGIQWLVDPAAKHDYERVIAPDFPIAHTISHKNDRPGKDILGQEIKSAELPDNTITEGDGVYKKTIKDEQGNDQSWYYSNYLGIVELKDEQLLVKPLIQVNKESPYSVQIVLYGFLGDEMHTRVSAKHIIETANRLNLLYGWNGELLVEVLYTAHKRRFSELEQDIIQKLPLLSTNEPVNQQKSVKPFTPHQLAPFKLF